MRRSEVVAFLNKEAKRLREEEHINELFKKNAVEKLAAIEVRTTKAINDSLYKNDGINLRNEEIPEGNCMAIAMWATAEGLWNSDIVLDIDGFAHRLAREAGDYGKNVAAQILDGYDLGDLSAENFFSTKFAKEYDQKWT